MNSICTDTVIRQWVTFGGVTPVSTDLINPTSIDLRLSSRILVDLGDPELTPLDISGATEDRPFELAPQTFALVSTVETVDFSFGINSQWFSGVVKLKSGRSREGLHLANAGWVDCGYRGTLTLAARNDRLRTPQKLWPGKRFAQLILFPHARPASLYDGNYQDSVGTISSVGYRG